jgi:2-polyprenyl-6-hydroxyphenyl methylase/3-demethylubiquinone-9 3-methyltransferase
MSATHLNQDPAELARFEAVAHQWWDKEGEFRALHAINPPRTDYIDRRVKLSGKRVLDVGCGGGLLCESMTLRGATVTGLDLGATALQVAELHALQSGLTVSYVNEAVEAHAVRLPHAYDVVTCLEMIEHVPDPRSVITALSQLVRPGGHVIVSTLNRRLKSFLLGIVAAEYILELIPRGTHSYERFIRPAELAAWARGAELELADMTGLSYDPITSTARLSPDISVNYLMHFTAPLPA